MLERFCREHNIDTAEIDDSLSYDENLKHLKSLVGYDVEELAEIYAKAYAEWEKAVDVAEIYGEIPEDIIGVPLLICRCWILIKWRYVKNAKIYLKRFPKHVEFHGKKYVLIRGQIETIFDIINVLLRNQIRFKILRVSTKRPSEWQYLPKIGWVKQLMTV